jgi:hypothetical protein
MERIPWVRSRYGGVSRQTWRRWSRCGRPWSSTIERSRGTIGRQIAGEDGVRWTVDGRRFAESTKESTAFVRGLFTQYGEALRELEVRRATLEDTYLTLVRQSEVAR